MRAVVLVAALAVAIAQAQQPAEQQPPTFRTGANLVRVDATVVDRRGNPVTALTIDDFEVTEDGIPQQLQSFKFVGATGRPAPGDELSLPIRSREHAAAEAARDEVRVFLIFWDEYHISPFVSAIAARRALTDFVLSQFGPTDLVALMDPLTPLDAIRFTRDRRELANAIHKLQGRRGLYVPPRSAAEEAQLELPRSIERVRAEVTASALEGAAIHLGTLREGRKSIIFVSESLGPLGETTMSVVRGLIRAANASNTAIYTLDPRGLGPRPSELLREVSDSTGAEAILSTNNPLNALRQVVRQASAFYLLGYSSERSPVDGKFHKIDVRVKRPGLEVRARKGYWAPSIADMKRARTEAAAVDFSPEVSAALSTLAPQTNARRTIDVWVGTGRRSDGTTDVTVAWTPRTALSGSQLPDRATLLVTSPEGTEYFNGPMSARHVTFSAPPGSLRIRVTALDSEGTIVDRDSREVAIPDYGATALALSVPVVVRLRNALDIRSFATDPQAPPFAGRDFSRTDRVLVRFAVYGNADPAIIVDARLMTRRGAALVALPCQRFTGPGEMYQVDLPLSSIARGEYLLAIDASQGTDHAQALVALRVQ